MTTETKVVAKSRRGGKREGAGMRPSVTPLDRVPLNVQASTLLAEYAKREHLKGADRQLTQGILASELLIEELRRLMPDIDTVELPERKPRRKRRTREEMAAVKAEAVAVAAAAASLPEVVEVANAVSAEDTVQETAEAGEA